MPEQIVGVKIELDDKGVGKGLDNLQKGLKTVGVSATQATKATRIQAEELKNLREELRNTGKAITANAKTTVAETNKQKESFKTAAQIRAAASREFVAASKVEQEQLKNARVAFQTWTDTQKQAVQTQRQVADAQRRQAEETKRSTWVIDKQAKAWISLIKKAALWALGARTVFRLIFRVRTEFSKAFKAVFENTEEYGRLTEAVKRASAAFILFLFPAEKTKDLFDKMAASISVMSDGILRASAIVQTYKETSGSAIPIILNLGKSFLIAGLNAENFNATFAALEDVRLGTEGVEEFGEVFNRILEEQSQALDNATASVDEQQKAFEKLQETLFKIQEGGLRGLLQAEKQYTEDMEQLERDHQTDLNEIFEEGIDRREEIALDGARRLAAIARQTQDRQGAIDRQLNRRLQDIELQAQSQSESNAFRHRQRLIDIERRYRDKLRDIERNYSDTLGDAIARRDATAALKAIRERRRGLEDATRERDEARSDATTDFNQQNSEQAQRLEEQRRAARRAHARQLEDLEIARRQQERELRISLEQQEEDLEKSLEDQERELQDSYARQLNDIVNHFVTTRHEVTRQNILDAIAAQNDYFNRENAYRRHLQEMNRIRLEFGGTGSSTPPGSTPWIPGYAEGGQFVASKPTLFVAGEGSSSELVTVMPMRGGTSQVDHSVSGSVTHGINVAINRSISGMEGRITAAVQRALTDLLR